MSGYTDCSCRDCFEIAIASDGETDPLCWECEEAGCVSNDGECCVFHEEDATADDS
jgi:hypothetical protein